MVSWEREFAALRRVGVMRCLRLTISLVTVAFAAASTVASDGDIGPGSSPPKIQVRRWLKGSPITEFKPKGVYVVEFWATWCGPCLETIPHLSSLAKTNKDVTFLGVSIWEEEEGDKLPKFVKSMGDKMAYNVGYSGNKDGMAKSWMDAAGQNGIPTAFIIKDRKIHWIGHPAEIDKPLAEVKSGNFDVKAFAKDFEKRAADNRKMIEASAAFTAVVELHKTGKKKEARAALNKVVRDYPMTEEWANRQRYIWLSEDDPVAWNAQTDKMLESGDPNKLEEVASFAFNQAQDSKGAAIARIAIAKALSANEKNNYVVLNYARNVYLKLGDDKDALDVITKMIELFPTSPSKDYPEYLKTLQKSKADLLAKLKG